MAYCRHANKAPAPSTQSTLGKTTLSGSNAEPALSSVERARTQKPWQKHGNGSTPSVVTQSLPLNRRRAAIVAIIAPVTMCSGTAIAERRAAV